MTENSHQRQTLHLEGRRWSIRAWPELLISTSKKNFNIELDGVHDIHVRRGLLSWRLVGPEGRLLRMSGLDRFQAAQLRGVIRVLQARDQIQEVTDWHSTVTKQIERACSEQRWFSTEALQRLIDATPSRSIQKLVNSLRLADQLTPFEIEAVAALDRNLPLDISVLNNQILENELNDQRDFLDTIESSPLTREQAEAVICFDNRVQLLAAAGSGKTSVMIARAAYAVKKGFCEPSRILLLAFNKAAAVELQQRIQTRFEAAGIVSSGIRASTFHSLGLSVIGKGTGSKPRLASWLETGDELKVVLEIVDHLRDVDPVFRYKWDLYRLIFAQTSTDINSFNFDGLDKENSRRGFQTLRDEIVRSHGERLIADFLFLNGINYEYERPYDHDVSDMDHSQYRPDFYYPEFGIWHEHWAFDANGNPPSTPEYANYRKSRAWKIQTHRKFKTPLVQSTWASVVFGDGLAKLQRDLEKHGLEFDWNPEREIPNKWAKQMDHPELGRLVRTFMAHVKSNSLTQVDVAKKLKESKRTDSFYGFRSNLFLDIYWPIHDAWNRRLMEQKAVDFEDMLLDAGDILNQGLTDLGYDLVLVDEFQDSSHARAHMIEGLLKKSDRFLLAVGDDWQSINRFAGADISVMRAFNEWYGQTLTLALTKTFRCPHAISHVASKFVQRNPDQIKKSMLAIKPSEQRSICVRLAPDDVLDSILEEIVTESRGERSSVLILGRYNSLRDNAKHREFENLDITFRTIHSSKGLEADFVIVLGLTNGQFGFPSEIADDPVLALAMPAAESFPFAEERRLFYVAMTRARKKVFLLTLPNTISPFVTEILKEKHVDVNFGEDLDTEVCSACLIGLLVKRTGPHGDFLGCSRFPTCIHTEKIQSPATPLATTNRNE